MLQVPDQKVPLVADRDGAFFVSGTRVSLHSVVSMFEGGASAEEIAHEFDSLDLPDVYAVIAYYLRNKPGLDAKLAEEERRSDEAAVRFERAFPNRLREKLRRRGG
jgi:uncharacterized protein (DUF433 family)